MRSQPTGTTARILGVSFGIGLALIQLMVELPTAHALTPVTLKVTILKQEPKKPRVVDPIFWDLKGEIVNPPAAPAGFSWDWIVQGVNYTDH